MLGPARRLALLIAVCSVGTLTAAGTARAEPLGTPVFKLRVVEEDGARQLTDVEQARFFNRANCLCDVPMQLEITIADAGAHPSDPVEIWVGQQCDTVDDLRDTRCEKLETQSLSDVRVLRDSETIALTVQEMTWPNADGCTSSKQEPEKIWFLIDENGDTTFEHAWSYDYNVDTAAPEPPASPTTSGVEDAIQLSWEPIETNADELYGFQVLCARASDGAPIFENPPGSIYESSLAQCSIDDPLAGPDVATPTVDAAPAPDGGGGGGADAAGLDAAGVDAVPLDAAAPADAAAAAGDAPAAAGDAASIGELDLLSGAFNCSGQISKTADGVRLDLGGSTLNLAAREEVRLWLVTVDNHRNARVLDLGTARPQPVADFWEVYEGQGGGAKGGFCGVAVAPRAARVGLGLLVGAAIAGLALRARRRRGGRGPGVLGVLLAAATGLAAPTSPAHAQVYLNEPGVETAAPLPRSDYAFELKLGPYIPDVDSEGGLSGKPFETVFGDDDNLMIQLELDRFLAWPLGQLGVGATLGYMQDTAQTFPLGTDGRPILDDDMRTSDETAFHLIPMALLVVYRFTALADQTPIPLVPYAKLGLSYYVWWVSKGDGSLASTEDKGDAAGGSLGWQGTIGLSVRADAFDPQAAINLSSEYGVEHAGFFLELTKADVDGFGSDDKLQVGATTWLAGVNFEF